MQNNEYLIGDRIKTARKEKNMTQRELSSITDIAESSISLFENAKKIPSLTNLARIAYALDVTIDELYFGNKSERFINKTTNKEEVIANCYYELWKHACIVPYNYSCPPQYSNVWQPGLLLAIKGPMAVESFLEQLNDYKENEKTYEKPEEYLRALKQSFTNRIKKEQNPV